MIVGNGRRVSSAWLPMMRRYICTELVISMAAKLRRINGRYHSVKSLGRRMLRYSPFETFERYHITCHSSILTSYSGVSVAGRRATSATLSVELLATYRQRKTTRKPALKGIWRDSSAPPLRSIVFGVRIQLHETWQVIGINVPTNYY